MQVQNPFHSGERLVQQRAGETSQADRNCPMIRDTIMPGALPFLRQQNMLIVGSASPEGESWASVLFGPKGFLESDDGRMLSVHLNPGARVDEDPLWENVAAGKHLGGLAIDLGTRHRLRMNGRVIANDPDLLTVAVEEAYPNCPKYIQRRLLKQRAPSFQGSGRAQYGNAILGIVREMVESADTLFVASANPRGGADVSHRGGFPGFVSVLDERTLSVPDYRGNSLFNTLGNLAINPAAGILIVDFAAHRVLQMTGEAEIHWPRDASNQEGPETGRSWSFCLRRWILRPLRAEVDWEFVDFSPNNPRQGAKQISDLPNIHASEQEK
jgi:uncharacterized protein